MNTTRTLAIGQTVRFAAGLYIGCEGIVERIHDNGTVVVRGEPLHGRGGPGFSANPEEQVVWGLAPVGSTASLADQKET